MAILITGGTGFLGSHLARYLLNIDGEKDLVLFDSHLNTDRIQDIQESLTLVQGDVTDSAQLANVMERYNVDRVVHRAFLLMGGREANPVEAVKINCNGTANVFHAAHAQRVRRLVYASSVAVYGTRMSLDDEEHNEETPAVPNTLYGAAKLFIEQLADVYHRQYGLDVVGLRPVSVFGLGRGQRYMSPQQHFMVRPEIAAKGKPIKMPPNETMIDWSYVKDAAKAWSCALNSPSPQHRVFNMAAERRPVGDYTAHAKKLLPNAAIEVNDEIEVSLHLVSGERLRHELNFQPAFTLEEGLEDYLEEAKTHKARGALG